MKTYPTIEALAKEGSRYACRLTQMDSTDEDQCQEYDAVAMELESTLTAVFVAATAVARGEDVIEEIAAIWNQVVKICDDVLECLVKLHGNNRECITYSYDKILDYRNAAHERCELHR